MSKAKKEKKKFVNKQTLMTFLIMDGRDEKKKKIKNCVDFYTEIS